LPCAQAANDTSKKPVMLPMAWSKEAVILWGPPIRLSGKLNEGREGGWGSEDSIGGAYHVCC